jgi:hypothetical protein
MSEFESRSMAESIKQRNLGLFNMMTFVNTCFYGSRAMLAFLGVIFGSFFPESTSHW